ncbi:carbohydrate ABC transporter permease [Cellulomonas sp. SLBN-39]|uniref:carbohydrate ABC transporter permease n=1 Tax=Cellulomonas sp. SLBN-39 TaxID=2768446 RepID=UPI0011549DBE|nr:carbohydrate ABC transporter permease [Cellulomonas sp. SLBN-39]TQL03629.1 cellobiose ABC transporter membrane protein [Cellulomonas sp. SLBN-39]
MSAPSLPYVRQTAGAGAARAAARRRRSGGHGSERRPGWVTYLLLTLALAVFVLPIYYAFLLASSDAQTIAQNPIPGLLPEGNFLANVQRVLESDIGFWQALTNSVIVATVTSATTVLFSTLAGFSFSKLRFRGRKGLLLFVIATTAVPTQLGIIPLFIVMSQLGWIGQLQAVIVPGLVTAFGVFWMTQYLESALPYELIEAARVDGASMIRTFWSVALPAARPAAVMLGLFTFVASWTNFFWPFIVLGSTNPTLPVALQLLQASYFKDMSLIMAGVVLSTIPLLVLFAVAGRQLVAGIMAGAVKG